MSKRKKKSPRKHPTYQGPQPVTSKSPRVASDPDSFFKDRPSWRITILEMCDPFGWHNLDAQTLHEIREKLKGFESMTWGEILEDGKTNHHRILVSRLCRDAKRRLQEMKQDDLDEVVSLRLSGKERIFGILEDSVLRLLWWDPNHQVCPSPKKHT